MSNPSPTRVLLLDRDRDQAQLITSMLAKATPAFDVELVQQLSLGLDRLNKHPFDIALLDISAPGSEEPEAIARIHAKWPALPVVVLTSPGTEDGPRALGQGAQDYVAKKQMSSRLLAHSLRRAISRSRAEKDDTPDSEQRFRPFIENAPDSVVVLDIHATMTYYSPPLQRMLGYEEGELIGSPILDLVHPEDVQNATEALSEVILNPGARQRVEVRVRHKDGSWHHVEVIGTNNLLDPAVKGIVLNVRDITERLEAEEAFRRKAAFYEQLIEHSMDGLQVLAADATILYRSPANSRQYGYETWENTGHAGFDLIHPDDLPNLTKRFAEFIATPGNTGTVECRGLHKDGTWHVFQAVGTNCLDDPAIKGLVVLSRDITFHKEMEEALKRSEAALKAALEQTKLSLEELSTPVLQVWSNILALPLMGLLDDRRGQQIMEILLQRIVETQSELVILDVTGVPSMDTQVVNYLMKTIRSASMLGAQCVLTGMKPYLAHAVINFGLDLNSLVIRRDMEEGLKWALEQMGYETSDGRASAAKEAVQEQQR